MEKTREYFKNLLAEHSLEILFDELFALMTWYKESYKDKFVAEKHDELVLLSGKLNRVQQQQHIGAIDPEEMNTEMSRINFALLDLLNDLPDTFFKQAEDAITGVNAGAQKRYAIPSGISNGLYWMGSAIVLMIAFGSLTLKNWVTFAFTLLAALVCMPATFDYFVRKFGISLSGSLRVLLIIVLTSVGLSFAKQNNANGDRKEQPQIRRE